MATKYVRRFITLLLCSICEKIQSYVETFNCNRDLFVSLLYLQVDL